MAHAISLLVTLFGVWLLLSGHYVPLIIGLGVGSCIFVVLIALRMDVADREGHPIHLTWRALIYWPWLMWQIILSSIQVGRIILDPKLPISPRLIWVRASQVDELGHVIYGNSITLTPGTVTLDIRGNELEVHALTGDFAHDLATGDMDRRVTKMEGAG